MSRALIAGLLLVTACAGAADRVTTTTSPSAATTMTVAPTTTTTTSTGRGGGHFVKLDPMTLEPVTGLDPIPIVPDSWEVMSPDGSLIVSVGRDARSPIRATVVDVAQWRVGGFAVGPVTEGAIHGNTLITYNFRDGSVSAFDLSSGEESVRGEWRRHLWLWDGLHVSSGGRISALGSSPSDIVDHLAHFSLFVADAQTGVTTEFPVGPIDRFEEKTGVYEGDYEIAKWDSPGVAWSEDRVFIVHAEDLEVTAIDLATGAVGTIELDSTTWWDRLWAYWMPAASAKGPSLGTYSSAVVSPDGRYLFISGNRHVVTLGESGRLIEESEHLGVTVIDTTSWRVVARSNLPIQFVRGVAGAVVGVASATSSPWVDNLYLLSMDDSGELVLGDPFTVTQGWCDLTPDHGHRLCFEHRGSSVINVEMIDLETNEKVTSRTIGLEDVLHANGVLVDRPPWPEG